MGPKWSALLRAEVSELLSHAKDDRVQPSVRNTVLQKLGNAKEQCEEHDEGTGRDGKR